MCAAGVTGEQGLQRTLIQLGRRTYANEFSEQHIIGKRRVIQVCAHKNPAALLSNMLASRMYLLTISIERWPVCAMMRWTENPSISL